MEYKNSASTIDEVRMIAITNKINSEEIIAKTDAIKIGIIEKGKTKGHLLLRSGMRFANRRIVKNCHMLLPRVRGDSVKIVII